jgi:tagaturonate epimerase
MRDVSADIVSYPTSMVSQDDRTYRLVRYSGKKWLQIDQYPVDFQEALAITEGSWLCPLTTANAAVLRSRFSWLNPVPSGLQMSFGFGDRIGMATPGHALAATGRGIFPLFAQQSVRENARIGRDPQKVIDDAMWGVFQAGWKEPWGADADHIKSTDDLQPFVDAGYTFFTIDPGEHVNDHAASLSGIELHSSFHNLPWTKLEDRPEELLRRLSGESKLPGGISLLLDEASLVRAAVKYGRAVANAAEIYQHLTRLLDKRPFDLEISLDETEHPTTPEEHFYVASELQRLGVQFVSLAPRYIGRFEKAVDYMGDPDAFANSLRLHTAVVNSFGFYRLSLHSGSDKFSIYPLLADITGNKAHVKTAGTSLLEGLRVAAAVRPELFQKIYELSYARYAQDRLTYHVSAETAHMPAPGSIASGSAALLDHFHVRQALHVTFASIIKTYGGELSRLFYENEPLYMQTLQSHFEKHLTPFA